MSTIYLIDDYLFFFFFIINCYFNNVIDKPTNEIKNIAK